MKEGREMTWLIQRAKALRKEMEAGSLIIDQLFELYGIYSITCEIGGLVGNGVYV